MIPEKRNKYCNKGTKMYIIKNTGRWQLHFWDFEELFSYSGLELSLQGCLVPEQRGTCRDRRPATDNSH
jgi:hypothetical protein